MTMKVALIVKGGHGKTKLRCISYNHNYTYWMGASDHEVALIVKRCHGKQNCYLMVIEVHLTQPQLSSDKYCYYMYTYKMYIMKYAQQS